MTIAGEPPTVPGLRPLRTDIHTKGTKRHQKCRLAPIPAFADVAAIRGLGSNGTGLAFNPVPLLPRHRGDCQVPEGRRRVIRARRRPHDQQRGSLRPADLPHRNRRHGPDHRPGHPTALFEPRGRGLAVLSLLLPARRQFAMAEGVLPGPDLATLGSRIRGFCYSQVRGLSCPLHGRPGDRLIRALIGSETGSCASTSLFQRHDCAPRGCHRRASRRRGCGDVISCRVCDRLQCHVYTV